MPSLFESTQIKDMTLSNRFVRSATWEGMAEANGTCTNRLTDLMVTLAAGGVGLIITGHTYVDPRGQAGPWQLGIGSDGHIPRLKEMTSAVHNQGGKIVMQLAHAGLMADTEQTGTLPLAPSAVDGYIKTPIQEMTPDDIKEVANAFGNAAERAQKAGFDGVQIHSAHGYLLSQFLSPVFNRRNDDYGGPVVNRARIILETYRQIRQSVGSEYPVLIKINTSDHLDGGLELSESIETAGLLQEAGIDAIELSGGTGASGKLRPVRVGIHSIEREAYFEEAVKSFRSQLKAPLILVGGIRSYETAERILTQNTADYISMSRPFIREPDLINRWKSGDRSRATCVSDNRCFIPIRKGLGVTCVTDAKTF
jgi:2,4-dienoyl-CoA reductase-like NADH-dependent reductase (Old Yellow Enzyme family)